MRQRRLEGHHAAEGLPVQVRPIDLAGARAKAGSKKVGGRIEVRNLSFEYREGVPVLNDISLVAERGTTTALVGPSGVACLEAHRPVGTFLRVAHRPSGTW